MDIKNSALDPANLFELDGLQYEKDQYIITYRDKELDSSGNIKYSELKVGLTSKHDEEFNKFAPINITDWSTGGVKYTTFDTLITGISAIIFRSTAP